MSSAPFQLGLEVVNRLPIENCWVVLRTKDRAAMIREIARVREHTTVRDEILVHELGYRPDHPVPCAMWFAEVKIKMDRKPGEEPVIKLGWQEYKGRKRATMIY